MIFHKNLPNLSEYLTNYWHWHFTKICLTCLNIWLSNYWCWNFTKLCKICLNIWLYNHWYWHFTKLCPICLNIWLSTYWVTFNKNMPNMSQYLTVKLLSDISQKFSLPVSIFEYPTTVILCLLACQEASDCVRPLILFT